MAFHPEKPSDNEEIPPAPHRARVAPATMYTVVPLGVVGGGLVWWGWWNGFYTGERLDTLLVLIQGALINAMVVGLVLWGWGRAARREALADQYERELRYFRTWSGEEGVLRKTGLIRDLNNLGLAPLDLEQTVMPDARLEGVALKGCNLREADLTGANLQGADLEGADFWGANLQGVNLGMARLMGANFRGANLQGANLVKADLRGGNLHRADLVGANLDGARLEMANLDKARFRQPGNGSVTEIIHPSVEDAIRGRLDQQGRYKGRLPEGKKRPESP